MEACVLALMRRSVPIPRSTSSWGVRQLAAGITEPTIISTTLRATRSILTKTTIPIPDNIIMVEQQLLPQGRRKLILNCVPLMTQRTKGRKQRFSQSCRVKVILLIRRQARQPWKFWITIIGRPLLSPSMMPLRKKEPITRRSRLPDPARPIFRRECPSFCQLPERPALLAGRIPATIRFMMPAETSFITTIGTITNRESLTTAILSIFLPVLLPRQFNFVRSTMDFAKGQRRRLSPLLWVVFTRLELPLPQPHKLWTMTIGLFLFRAKQLPFKRIRPKESLSL